MSTNLSTDQINAFREEGYLIVPGLFDAEEARILHAAAKADQAFEDHAYDLEDSEGSKAQLVLWNKAGEDLWGSIAAANASSTPWSNCLKTRCTIITAR